MDIVFIFQTFISLKSLKFLWLLFFMVAVFHKENSPEFILSSSKSFSFELATLSLTNNAITLLRVNRLLGRSHNIFKK